MKTIFKILLLLIITITPIVTYTFIRDDVQFTFNANYKTLNRYFIKAEFDPVNKAIYVDEKVNYINNTGKKLKKIYFHIYPNAFKTAKTAPYFEEDFYEAYPNGFDSGYIDIKKVTVDNRKSKYNIIGRDHTILMIELEKWLENGAQITVHIQGRVKIPNSRGRFGYDKYTFNITNWYPILAVYDEDGWNLDPYYKLGDPFYSDISNYRVEFIVPSDYFPVSTGVIIDKKRLNDRLKYYIKADNVRDFAIILSNKFKKQEAWVDNIRVVSYCFDDLYKKAALQYAVDSIKVFNDLFGKYPYEEFEVVASDFYIGGMEYPNVVMIDKDIYSNEQLDILEYIIVHETAHQWWYGVVGNDQIDEPWLDESLTEYSTILYYEKKYGQEVKNKVFNQMVINRFNKYEDYSFINKSINKSLKNFNSWREYSALVYQKGAISLNEFRRKIGDEKFFNILKLYFEKNMFKNAKTEDFIEICREVLKLKNDETIIKQLSIR
ncbi:M1 family metallopeptidase [Caloranaerobacter azorensis]|uniref:M1 family metallopeptidase n=1 Tax=Caloranaerobacter azorensis TaxID=116090 RepID=A0A6P1YGL0_9FIRM|nr:M1 family metallopeptidase [Caloranaerobacter azorensis]QIB27913.1 M1 family metallopeptidase [Caloranaerobacter azorensis]